MKGKAYFRSLNELYPFSMPLHSAVNAVKRKRPAERVTNRKKKQCGRSIETGDSLQEKQQRNGDSISKMKQKRKEFR